MNCVEFYSSNKKNPNGDSLSSILSFSKEKMEAKHDFIQWMFPSNEPSQMCDGSPVLTEEEAFTFCQSHSLQFMIETSFSRFIWFLELEENENGKLVSSTEDTPWWLKEFNHNMLRITRVLKCMRLVGRYDLALKLYDFLKENEKKVSKRTFQFWTEAVTNPLWKTNENCSNAIKSSVTLDTADTSGSSGP